MARDRFNFQHHEKAGFASNKTKILLLVAFEDAEHFESITNTFDKKFETLQMHKSQVIPDKEFEKRIRARSHKIGKKAKAKYAEEFKRMELS